MATKMLHGPLAAALMFAMTGNVAAQDGSCLSDEPGDLPAEAAELLQQLPESARIAFEGYGSPVFPSPYQDFVAPEDGPWTIGYNNSFSGNAWRAAVLAGLERSVEEAGAAGLVDELIITDSNGNITTQIQQMRSLIQRGVDLIISIPGSPTAMNGVIAEAYEAGIPVVTLAAPVTTPYAINVDTNGFLIGKTMALGLVRLLDGEGDIIAVQGIPGTSGSALIEAGGRAVFENCPDITIVADLAGQWSNSTAQTVVLQTLSTNPTEIDGIWQQGSMFMGAVRALEQAGRPLVPVTVGNPDQNALAFWHDNLANGFETVGSSNAPGAGIDLAFRVGMRVLQGEGLTVSSVVVRPPLITSDTLEEWWKPEFTVDSTGVGEPPPDTWMPDAILDGYFTNPGAAGQ